MRTRLRETAATVGSSRYRAWRRLLAGLTLDPDALPDPLAGPGPRDFVVCGAPRTGTALLTAMLFQPPDIVTVMEPWDALRLPPAELFRSLRDEIDSTGVLTRGRLDVAALRAEGAVRWCHDGELPEPVSTSPGYLLGVKMPALWRYLDRLPNTKFLVCLRDPVEVVHSFCATGGRLAQGLDYDVPFNRAMNEDLLAATHDDGVRRALLYEYVNSRVLPHLQRDNVLPVRYERWFTDPDGQLADIAGFLGVVLPRRPAVLRPPTGRPSRAEAELARRYCGVASALGYDAALEEGV